MKAATGRDSDTRVADNGADTLPTQWLPARLSVQGNARGPRPAPESKSRQHQPHRRADHSRLSPSLNNSVPAESASFWVRPARRADGGRYPRCPRAPMAWL
jgi:hypothetical protein